MRRLLSINSIDSGILKMCPKKNDYYGSYMFLRRCQRKQLSVTGTKFGLKLSVELLPGDVSLAGSEVSDALGW